MTKQNDWLEKLVKNYSLPKEEGKKEKEVFYQKHN